MFTNTDLICWGFWSIHASNGKDNMVLILLIKGIPMVQIRSDLCCHRIRELSEERALRDPVAPAPQAVSPCHLKGTEPAKGKLRCWLQTQSWDKMPTWCQRQKQSQVFVVVAVVFFFFNLKINIPMPQWILSESFECISAKSPIYLILFLSKR